MEMEGTAPNREDGAMEGTTRECILLVVEKKVKKRGEPEGKSAKGEVEFSRKEKNPRLKGVMIVIRAKKVGGGSKSETGGIRDSIHINE